MSSDLFANRSKWKQIAKSQRKTPRPVVQPEQQIPRDDAPQDFYFPHTSVSHNALEGIKYILYDTKPICLLNGILYAMLPIDVPTLGYKLVDGNFDKTTILTKPRYINEQQAIELLFFKKG